MHRQAAEELNKLGPQIAAFKTPFDKGGTHASLPIWRRAANFIGDPDAMLP